MAYFSFQSCIVFRVRVFLEPIRFEKFNNYSEHVTINDDNDKIISSEVALDWNVNRISSNSYRIRDLT